MTPDNILRKTIFSLFFLSGAIGLVYEVVWVRLLAQSFGNTVFAVSTVLAVFMAGLGAGSYVVGKWVDRRQDALRVYGYLELGIGLAALLVLLFLRLLDPLVARAASLLEASFFGQSLLRLGASFLLLFPPTFLMGGTLPVLSKFALRRRESLGWDIGALYSINTLGAVAGAFLSGFFFIDLWGLAQTEVLAVSANLLIGGAALLIARTLPPHSRERGATEPRPRSKRQSPTLAYTPRIVAAVLLAYSISGFAALAGEVIWSRVLVFFLGNSTYAFSTMVATFLAGLAIGSFIGSKLADRVPDPLKTFALLEGILTLLILSTIPILWQGLHAPAIQSALMAPRLPWAAYLGLKFFAAALVLFTPALLFGMVFPLVCKITIVRLEQVGRGVGTIYALNTCGAILGSLLAGFVFIPHLGLQGSLVGMAWLTAALAVLLLLLHPSARPRLRASAVGAALGLAAVTLAIFPVQPAMRSANQTADDRVLFYSEDHTATVVVFQKPSGEKYVSVDGHFIGATEHESDKKQRLLGYLPVMLARTPKSALTIGLGSGITLGALAENPALTSIEAVEIVPSMLAAARFFREEHGAVLSNPKVRVVIGDGINFVRTTRQKFDVISSDAKLNPEYVGNALVYTQEYYEWSRAHLKPGGVFVQWVPLYLPPSIFRTVVRTFCKVFPAADLWFFPQQHAILVGRNEREPFDFGQMSRRLDADGVRQQLARFGLGNAYILASSHVAGREQLEEFAGDGPINAWDHPVIEFRAVREFRRAPRGVAEERNLRQLMALLRPSAGAFSHVDPDSLRSYAQSFRLVLRGLLKTKRPDLLSYGRPDFQEALQQNPNEGRAQDLLAQVGRESRLLQAAASAPTSRGSEALRVASLLYAQGEYAEAEQAARRAVRLEPTQPAGYNILGLALVKRGKRAEALQAFQKAYELDPNDVDITLNLATEYDRQGRLDEALGLFQSALRLDPDSPEIHNNLGIVYAEMGRRQAAIAEYRKSIQLDPTNADAFNNLGIALGMQGAGSQAIEAFKKALELQPGHAGALKNLGVTYLRMKEFSRAAEILQEVVKLGAADADVLTNLGLAYIQTGRPREARRYWEQALSLDPNLEEPRKNLEILKRMGY